MRNESFYLVIGICGFMYGIISHSYSNLEYKGYERIQGCTGECYEEYVAENGTPAEIERKKKAAAADDPFSSIRGLWAGCAACHGQSGQGMGIFPKLAGQDADTIIEKEKSADIFINFRGKETYKEIRKICVEAILHTDMTQHFSMVKDLSLLQMSIDEEKLPVLQSSSPFDLIL